MKCRIAFLSALVLALPLFAAAAPLTRPDVSNAERLEVLCKVMGYPLKPGSVTGEVVSRSESHGELEPRLILPNGQRIIKNVLKKICESADKAKSSGASTSSPLPL